MAPAAFIADGDRVLWCAGPYRVRLAEDAVEYLLGLFIEQGARKLYFQLEDAHREAGGVPRIHPFRKAAA